MNLFVVYIGGDHEKAHIELHDMCFVLAETLEDTFPALRASWWGTPESLHVDAWAVLTHADGYAISIARTPPADRDLQLYFVNIGGYDPDAFTEIHKNVFVVAPTESKAKVRALKQILDWPSHHRDHQYEVEKLLDVGNALGDGYFLHLTPTSDPVPFAFTLGYKKVGAE